MSEYVNFSAIAGLQKIDRENGVIHGVCVMCIGDASGHGLKLDDKSLKGFLTLANKRTDGIKTRFGADHDAGASDINGSLKNFRLDGGRIRADLHLLKTDKNFSKIVEMAEQLPNEFGLSASTSAIKEEIDGDQYVRFTAIQSVDIVSNPAATNGLFLSAINKQPTNTMLKQFALQLGLPETATETEVSVALKKMCEMSEKEKEEKKKEFAAKEKAEQDAKDGDKSVKFSADLEAIKLELAAIRTSTKAAQDSAHKAEIENLKLEASRDGKVIPVADETLLKLSIPEIKDMISKLPKAQIQLSRRSVTPVAADGKAITDRNSPEFKAYLARKREEGAIALGQRMINAVNLTQN